MTELRSSINSPWLNRLKSLDVYTKTRSEATARGAGGGLVTIVVVLVMSLLLINEVSEWWRPQTKDVLSVDIVRGEKLALQFDFTFPGIKCAAVTIDLLDASGAHAQAEGHHIKKTRLDAQGNVLAVDFQKEISENGSVRKLDLPGYCHACESELPQEEVEKFRKLKGDKTLRLPHCCNKCENLLNVFSTLKLPAAEALRREPCKPKQQRSKDLPNEAGCRVAGYIRIPKIEGNLHVAAGRSTKQSHGTHSHHMHQISFGKALSEFNVSHIIHKLHFGDDFDGKVEPLNGVSVMEPELAQYIYFVRVVPTVYRYANGFEKPVHQYSYTVHREVVRMGGSRFPLPGMFIKFKFDAIRMTKHAGSASFAHFITRTCALVGGAFVVLGLVYRMISGGVDMIKKTK